MYVRMVQEQQGRVLGMLDTLSLSTQAALAGLEARLLALEAKADACLPGGVTAYSRVVTHSHTQHLRQQGHAVMSLCDMLWQHIMQGLLWVLLCQGLAPYSTTAFVCTKSIFTHNALKFRRGQHCLSTLYSNS